MNFKSQLNKNIFEFFSNEFLIFAYFSSMEMNLWFTVGDMKRNLRTDKAIKQENNKHHFDGCAQI